MGKVRLNDDQEVVALIREGLKRTDGYCPCRLARTPENKCMCEEFREQIPISRATATAAFTTKKNKPSHRVRGAAAPRIVSNPFFAAACTSQKHFALASTQRNWPRQTRRLMSGQSVFCPPAAGKTRGSERKPFHANKLQRTWPFGACLRD